MVAPDERVRVVVLKFVDLIQVPRYGVIGTLRSNRSYIPDSLKMSKRDAKKLPNGTLLEALVGGWALTQLYVDNTPVLFLSTVTQPGERSEV